MASHFLNPKLGRGSETHFFGAIRDAFGREVEFDGKTWRRDETGRRRRGEKSRRSVLAWVFQVSARGARRTRVLGAGSGGARVVRERLESRPWLDIFSLIAHNLRFSAEGCPSG